MSTFTFTVERLTCSPHEMTVDALQDMLDRVAMIAHAALEPLPDVTPEGMDADAVRAYVAAKFPDAMQSPVARMIAANTPSPVAIVLREALSAYRTCGSHESIRQDLLNCIPDDMGMQDLINLCCAADVTPDGVEPAPLHGDDGPSVEPLPDADARYAVYVAEEAADEAEADAVRAYVAVVPNAAERREARSAARAIAKFGADICRDAYAAHEQGNGAGYVAEWSCVGTVARADQAINAGRFMQRKAYAAYKASRRAMLTVATLPEVTPDGVEPDAILEAYFRGCDGSVPASLRMVTHSDASEAFIAQREINAELVAALEWALRVHFDVCKRESEPWTDAARAALAKVQS